MPDWRNPDDYAYLEHMLPRGWVGPHSASPPPLKSF